MSASSITVATNAVLLKRVEPSLRAAERTDKIDSAIAPDGIAAPAQPV
jgi:hypothetical protein